MVESHAAKKIHAQKLTAQPQKKPALVDWYIANPVCVKCQIRHAKDFSCIPPCGHKFINLPDYAQITRRRLPHPDLARIENKVVL